MSAARHWPAGILLQRYRAVLGAAWRQRGTLAGPALLADEAAFLPAALSLQHTPPHPAPRRAAFVLMALFGIALLWAWVGQVDIVAVAPGRVIVGERSKLVQPLERSVVKRVLVQDGDHVSRGQALVELDPTSATADTTTVRQQLQAALSERLRAGSLLQSLNGAPHAPKAVFPADWATSERDVAQTQLALERNDIASRLARLSAEVARREAEIITAREMLGKLEITLPLSQQREDDFKALASQGFVASHAGQDRTRERIELERDLLTQRARLQEQLAALAESENGRAAYLAETRRGLAERMAQATLKHQQAVQELAKASQRERLTILAAPAAGTVQQLAVHTVGGVVTEAQTLMIIVPDSAIDESLIVEVALENKDIGFVRAGQEAEIKLETFLFTRYGTLSATVQIVTADAVMDEKRGAIFPARLLLKANRIAVDGNLVRLTPGMNVTAEIKTGRRRVLDFLLSPVQRVASESLRER
ncbi:MAG: HlyD family type I secretion periplasmic adaptor subunit [Burkholderiaceae bacterium]